MRLALLLSLLPLAAACTPEAGKIAADDELAADLWSEIDGYDGWNIPDGWSETPVLSGSHSGAFVVTYLDDALAAWDGTGTAPEGAVAVKEAYDDEAGTTLTGLTVMKKIAGYDEAAGDWFWASYSPDGTVGSAGKVEMCSGCHASASADYVYADPPSAE